MKLRAFCLTAVALGLAVFASAVPAGAESAAPEGARFVFDSDRDIARDKMRAVYLWEDGRTAKLFAGAIHPRWSIDGERIACVLQLPGKEGAIAILDRSGKMRLEIAPAMKARAVEWLDDDTLIYTARDAGETGIGRTSLIRYDLKTNAERTLYATGPGGEIHQLNWGAGRGELILDITDFFGADALKRRAALLDMRGADGIQVVYDYDAYKPALFHDNETLIFQSALGMDGKPAAKAGEGSLAAYHIPSGNWAGVRRALLVQNTRFSRGGGYFYTAEGEGGDAVVIRLFSVTDLERPVIRVSPEPGLFRRAAKDLRPDLIIPSEVVPAAPIPVFLPGAALSQGTSAPEAVAQGAAGAPAPGVRARVPIPRVAERLARPELPERLPQRLPERLPDRMPQRLPWRPDPNRQALADRIPLERPAELPQLTQGTHEPIGAGQKITGTKTYDPLMKATDARQEVYLKETTPSPEKLTASKPYDPLTKAQDTGDGLLATGGSKTAPTAAEATPELTAEPADQRIIRASGHPAGAGQKYSSGIGEPLQIMKAGSSKSAPSWFRVPPDSTPIERGWYYETEAGDRFTTQYNEDYTEYTYTEEGPNFNSKTTYPVGGGLKQQ